MTKPRVALLPPRVWHSTWGQEKNLVSHLAKSFRIDVLDLMDFGGRHRKAGRNHFPPPDGVRVIERPTPKGLILQGLYLELANYFRLLFGPYQMLITYLTLGGALAAMAAKMRGMKVLLIYADDYVTFYRAQNKLAGWITARLANPLVASLADEAAATARLLARDLEPYAGRVHYIPNGVAVEKLGQIPIKKEGRFTVGFVGGFGHWVDFEAVVEAARLTPQVNFVLVGGGDRFAEVKEMAVGLENLTMTGQVDYDRVGRELAGMDACLIPFKVSRLTDRVSPIKLFEYWAAGRPVIASPIKEVVETAGERNGRTAALFYRDGCGRELAEIINRLAAQPDLAAGLRREGSARLKSNDWSEIIKRYWTILAGFGFVGQGK